MGKLRPAAPTATAVRLTRALATVDPGQAEARLRAVLDRTLEREDYALASATAGALVNLLRDGGQLAKALTFAEKEADYTRRAGCGPWTQLSDTSYRLQLLYRMGQLEPVLAEVLRLRERMDRLPAEQGDNERVEPWNVREVTLQLGAFAARDLGKYEQALALNAAVRASNRQRDASLYEQARTAFNDYGPLLRLGRLAEADELLCACQEVFEDADDPRMLGTVLSARADVADERGHREAAVNFEAAALRRKYVRADPNAVQVSHHNLAIYLRRQGEPPAQWLAHRLAAALLCRVTGMASMLTTTLRTLARELADPAAAARVPTTIDQVRSTVEQVEGVHFAALLAALEPDPARRQAALDEILTTARTMQRDDLDRHLQRWEPRSAAIVAAVQGDQAAHRQVEEVFDRYADSDDWAALVRVLRRVLAGERNPEALLAGLDAIDTAIVTRLLDALAGRVQLASGPVAEDTATRERQVVDRWEPVLALIVAAVAGDEAAHRQVEEVFDRFADSDDWAALVRVLRRVLAGERNPEALLAGLDAIDTAIVTRLVTRLQGGPGDDS